MADTAIWNFRQLAHHELDGFGGIGEGMSIQIAKDGRRILWLAHEAPRRTSPRSMSVIRARQKSSPAATCRNRICARTRWRRSATSWRSPTRRHSPAFSPPGSSCSISPCRKTRARSLFRLLRSDFARRPSAVVRRRRIHPYEFRRAGFSANPPPRRPVLSDYRRQEPVQAGRGRALVASRHQRGRQRSRRRSATPRRPTPAFARTTPTSIRNAPIARISVISTAGW